MAPGRGRWCINTGALHKEMEYTEMESLTPLECLFLNLFGELSEQQRQDVLRVMEALVQSSK